MVKGSVMGEQKKVVECEYAGETVFKGAKSKKCLFGGLACYHYDEPEIYAKCPERRKHEKVTE
jgi:hypothetical protein